MIKASTSFLLLFLLCILFKNPVFSQACNSGTIQLESQVQMLFSVPLGIVADRLNRPYCYVAGKEGGLSVFNIGTIQSPQPVINLPTSFFDSLDVMYLFQDSIYLYVALGNFFGTTVQKPGLAIVDVSIPSNPQLLDLWKWTTVTKGASTVMIHDNYAYLGAMNQGVFILNIANKSNITLESNYIPDPDWPVVNPNVIQEPNARGMAYRNDTLYLCYDAGGLRIIDVINKTSPMEIGHYLNPGALNKQQAFNHIILHGGLAYIAEDYCGLEVVDISNINNIIQTGWWNPWGCELPTTNWNGCNGHTNQLVYDSVLQVVYMSTGDSELRLVDVTNPSLPDSCNGFGPVGNSKACWGMDVYGPTIYITYINAFVPYFSNWSGFKALSWPLISEIKESDFQDLAFEISPNPATSYISLRFLSGITTTYEICFFNQYGQLIKSIWRNKDIEKISITDLTSGLYFIRIRKDTSFLTQKFFKF